MPDRAAPGQGASTLTQVPPRGTAYDGRVSVRKHLLIVLVLGVLTFGSAAFQAAAAQSGGSSASSTFRLVCPLH
jgi:hypothetical protein